MDDAWGILDVSGLTCEDVLSHGTCSFDLSLFFPSWPAGMQLSSICQASCGECGDPCADHTYDTPGSIADFVKAYLTKLGTLNDSDARTVFESIMSDPDFTETVLDTKLTVADLHFYRYYYAKRDWASVDADGAEESHISFLNPNNWAAGTSNVVFTWNPDDLGSQVGEIAVAAVAKK